MVTIAAIWVLSFATVSLFIIGITMKGERAVLRDRVDALRLSIDQDIDMIAPELSQPLDERVIRPWLSKLAGLFTRFLPSHAAANVANKLDRAGNPWKLKPTEFIGLKVLSFVVFLAAGIAIATFTELSTALRIIAIILGALIGITLPDAILDNRIGERHRIIRKSLADCIDLLVVSAEAGLGFDGAIAKVVERVRGPLADEFNRVLQEMSIGKSRMETLRSMSTRVGMPEIKTFVAAIHQADLLGVSIAHVLRVQAETLRSQRNIRARETAAKLPVKMLFPLVFFIFPAIFIVLLSPAVIQIYRALK